MAAGEVRHRISTGLLRVPMPEMVTSIGPPSSVRLTFWTAPPPERTP